MASQCPCNWLNFKVFLEVCSNWTPIWTHWANKNLFIDYIWAVGSSNPSLVLRFFRSYLSNFWLFRCWYHVRKVSGLVSVRVSVSCFYVFSTAYFYRMGQHLHDLLRIYGTLTECANILILYTQDPPFFFTKRGVFVVNITLFN